LQRVLLASDKSSAMGDRSEQQQTERTAVDARDGGPDQLLNEFVRFAVQDLVSGVDGRDAEGLSDVALARTGRTGDMVKSCGREFDHAASSALIPSLN